MALLNQSSRFLNEVQWPLAALEGMHQMGLGNQAAISQGMQDITAQMKRTERAFERIEKLEKRYEGHTHKYMATCGSLYGAYTEGSNK